MKLVCEHEFAGKDAFLFQAVWKPTNKFSLEDVALNRQMLGRAVDNAEKTSVRSNP